MCLRVTGPLRAMKCRCLSHFRNATHSALQRDLGEDVVAQVAQHAAGVGQLGAAQVELVVRHHLHELKDLLPAHLRNATHSALQRDLGEDVVAQVAQHAAGVGQLGAAQVELVVRHHLHELKDLLPAGDEARAQHVVHRVPS